MIVACGLSHKTAALEVRERYAIPPDAAPRLLRALTAHPRVSEAMLLSTCNRVEVFARLATPTPNGRSDAEDHAAGMRAVFEVMAEELSRFGAPLSADAVAGQFYVHLGEQAVAHLFRVAASLDSMVVGEPQILGQLKDACEVANLAGTLRGHLGRCVAKALSVAKRVRTETQLGAGTVSVSSVALELAERIFGDLRTSTVLLVGAGEMAEAAARAIGKNAKSIRVCNRSVERAAHLAAQFGGSAAPLEALEDELAVSDVVIASTGATHFLVTKSLCERVMKRRKGRSLFFIDIAVPRNVDPAAHSLDNVYVYNVDDLEQQVAVGLNSRKGEALRAEQLVRADVESFLAWQQGLKVQPYVVALRESVQNTLMSELNRTLSGKLRHLSDEDRETLAVMMTAATNKVLHTPTVRLKAATQESEASELAHSLGELFALDAAVTALARAKEEPAPILAQDRTNAEPALPSLPPSQARITH